MKDKTSLVFTGDIGFDKYMDGKWDDEELISSEVLDFLHSGSHVIANVEGALIDRASLGDTTGVGQLLHSMNPKAVKVLDRMRADIWNICNNHIMDAGEEGVAETLRLARLHSAKTIGAGMNIDEASKPLILDEAGGIGLISVGYRRGCKPADVDKAGCFMWHEMEMIEEKIKEVKKSCRWCVMVVHGGEEFTSLPSPYTRKRYLKYLEMGADIVVSHHPHVPMNYEKVGEKIIFYSLGNFIFDTDYQRAQFNTEFGLLIKLNFTKDNYTWKKNTTSLHLLQLRCWLRLIRGSRFILSPNIRMQMIGCGERTFLTLKGVAESRERGLISLLCARLRIRLRQVHGRSRSLRRLRSIYWNRYRIDNTVRFSPKVVNY